MTRAMILLDLRDALGSTRTAGKDEDDLLALAVDELRRLREQDESLRRARRVMRQWWTQDEIDGLYACGKISQPDVDRE